MAIVDGGQAVPVVVNDNGSFAFDPTVVLGSSADGNHLVRFVALDGFDNQSSLDVHFTLDTHAPTITVSSPAAGLTTDQNITVAGVVADDRSGVDSFQAQLDAGPFVPVTFDAAGHFSFSTMLALDGSADGSHTIYFQATDKAGNVSSLEDFAFTLSTHHVDAARG